MPFWSTNFGQSVDLKDPKRQFRFKVEFTGIQSQNGGQLLWYAKTVSKPSFSVNTSTHTYLNHVFNYPGAVTWGDVSVSLVDPVGPDMSATLTDIVVQSGYTPPTDANSMGTMSKAKAAGALGTVFITQIDGDGEELEKWTLWNAFISEVKYGDLAYGTDDLTELSITLKYDWAKLDVFSDEGSAQINGFGNKTFFKS
jgi:hypothetical protein